MKQMIENAGMLDVKAPNGGFTTGGSQEWYTEAWHKKAGCGPTTGSEMVWYLSRTNERAKALWDVGSADRASFLRLMDVMFTYITPGMRGVNSASMFTGGIERFARERGVVLSTRAITVPPIAKCRPTAEELFDFLAAELGENRPVAFLNLSNGTLKNLDNWHWVLIFGCDRAEGRVTICDQGQSWEIDLVQWLRSSVMGGGFVSAVV